MGACDAPVWEVEAAMARRRKVRLQRRAMASYVGWESGRWGSTAVTSTYLVASQTFQQDVLPSEPATSQISSARPISSVDNEVIENIKIPDLSVSTVKTCNSQVWRYGCRRGYKLST